jgi:starch phosphorylase
MNMQTRADHPIYSLLPIEIEGFGSLAELTLNMRSSWNHATDGVWQQLDPKKRK